MHVVPKKETLLLEFFSKYYSNDIEVFCWIKLKLLKIYDSYDKIKDTLNSERVIENHCSEKCLDICKPLVPN